MTIEWQRDGDKWYADIGKFRITLEPALGALGVADAMRADVSLDCHGSYRDSFKLGHYAYAPDAQRLSVCDFKTMLRRTLWECGE